MKRSTHLHFIDCSADWNNRNLWGSYKLNCLKKFLQAFNWVIYREWFYKFILESECIAETWHAWDAKRSFK